jgi:hypothetical protein
VNQASGAAPPSAEWRCLSSELDLTEGTGFIAGVLGEAVGCAAPSGVSRKHADGAHGTCTNFPLAARRPGAGTIRVRRCSKRQPPAASVRAPSGPTASSQAGFAPLNLACPRRYGCTARVGGDVLPVRPATTTAKRLSRSLPKHAAIARVPAFPSGGRTQRSWTFGHFTTACRVRNAKITRGAFGEELPDAMVAPDRPGCGTIALQCGAERHIGVAVRQLKVIADEKRSCVFRPGYSEGPNMVLLRPVGAVNGHCRVRVPRNLARTVL